VEQLLSAPAAHFKGSGFYATDYPRKGSGSSDESSSSETKKADSSTESKPAAKTESKSRKEK
jgi:predicted nucleic acid-binding Zn ribbon protein